MYFYGKIQCRIISLYNLYITVKGDVWLSHNVCVVTIHISLLHARTVWWNCDTIWFYELTLFGKQELCWLKTTLVGPWIQHCIYCYYVWPGPHPEDDTRMSTPEPIPITHVPDIHRPGKVDSLFLISHFLNLTAGGRSLIITSSKFLEVTTEKRKSNE